MPGSGLEFVKFRSSHRNFSKIGKEKVKFWSSFCAIMTQIPNPPRRENLLSVSFRKSVVQLAFHPKFAKQGTGGSWNRQTGGRTPHSF
jgi:hypothetical protein